MEHVVHDEYDHGNAARERCEHIELCERLEHSEQFEHDYDERATPAAIDLVEELLELVEVRAERPANPLGEVDDRGRLPD